MSKKLLASLTDTGLTMAGGEGIRGGGGAALRGRLSMWKPPSGTLVGDSIAASGIGIRVSYLDYSAVPFERHETLRLSFGKSRLTLQKSSGRARLPLSSTFFIHSRSD